MSAIFYILNCRTSVVGLNLPFIIDKNLYRYPFIYGGTGERTCTLKINPQALDELNSVQLIFG